MHSNDERENILRRERALSGGFGEAPPPAQGGTATSVKEIRNPQMPAQGGTPRTEPDADGNDPIIAAYLEKEGRRADDIDRDLNEPIFALRRELAYWKK